MNAQFPTCNSIELEKKLSDHLNGQLLTKMLGAAYFGDMDEVYYKSSRGDTGDAEEQICLYVQRDGMAVELGFLVGDNRMYRLPKEYVSEKNLILDDYEKNYIFDLSFNIFSMAENPCVSVEYKHFLKDIKKSISMKCFSKFSKIELHKFCNEMSKKLELSGSLLDCNKRDARSIIMLLPTTDGSFVVDRMITLTMRQKITQIGYVYPVYTSEQIFYENANDLEKVIDNVISRIPDNEKVEADAAHRFFRR